MSTLTLTGIGQLVVDPGSGTVITDTSLAIEAGRVLDATAPPPGGPVLDAAGGCVIPGLIDALSHPYFGDYSPHFDARGALEATLRSGTVRLVGGGVRDLPGAAPDQALARYLPILAARSWVADRPLGLKVHAALAMADPGLTAADLDRFAREGILGLVFAGDALFDAAAPAQASAARSVGLLALADLRDGAAPVPVEHVQRLEPAVVLGVNQRRHPLAPADAIALIETTGAALGLAALGSWRATVEIVRAGAARRTLERLLVGSDSPTGFALAPGALWWFVAQLSALPELGWAGALACATCNPARVFALGGGALAAGAAGDAVILEAGALDLLTAGLVPEVRQVIVDGVPLPPPSQREAVP